MGFRAFVGGLVVVGGVAGGLIVSGVTGGGAAPGTANLWVDTNGGTCTFQSTPSAYVDAAACASASAAYTTANSASPTAGITVGIRTGSYSTQTIPDSARTGGDIAFFGDGGAVTFASLEVNGDKTAWAGSRGWLTITKGLSTESNTTRMKGATFDGVITKGGGVTCPSGCANAWWMQDAQDVVFKNGEICCGQSSASLVRELIRSQVPAGTQTTVANITIENNDIHDWDRDDLATHSECALLLSIQGLTVRNNHFWNCTVYSISLARLGGSDDPDPSDTLLENNTFEPSDLIDIADQDGNSNIVLDHVNTRFNNLVIRNNSFSQNIEINTADVPDATGYDQTSIVSNILPLQSGCVPGGMTSPAYAGNVLPTGATCGAVRTNVATPENLYTSHGTAGTWNFHIAAGSAARGAASTTAGQFSTSDIGGFPRDGAPDAGAYEFGSGS